MSRCQAGSLDELPIGSLRKVECGGNMICLARTAEREVFAIDDAWTHEGYSLGDDGELDGREVECSMHGSTFDLSTGAVTGPPARIATRTYPVELDGERIYIEV